MALALVPVHGLSDDEQHEGRHSGCPSSLAAVDSLSDHETETADGCQMVPVQPIQPPRPDPCQKKRKEQPSSVLQASMLRRKLFQVVSSACPCTQHGRFRHHAGSCCQQFRSELDTLVQLRLRLSRLEKHDADNEVPISCSQWLIVPRTNEALMCEMFEGSNTIVFTFHL